MTSIDVEIAKLSSTTPQFLDINDHEDTESPALFENEHKNLFQRSKLRSRTAPLLEDIDQTYSGRKVTRKSRGLVFKKENSESKEKAELEFLESNSDTDEDDMSDEDDELSEDNIACFKKDLVNKSSSEAEESNDQDSCDSGTEETEKDNMVSQFANVDVNSEIEKGNAIKAQQEIWNKLCECRIKLQKLLIVSNKLPQTSRWLAIKNNKSGEEAPDLVSKGNDAVKTLLNSLIHLKQEIDQNTEKESIGEMEIPSDSNEECEINEVNKEETNVKKGVKRKYKTDDYSEILSQQFKAEKAFRNSIIQKWDEKVRLSTGRMTQKSFNAFNNSAVKQIEQILQDRTRLVKRTQLKRSVYRVLGKPEFSDLQSNKSNIEETTSKQDLLLKDYDTEIFDDDDFYRQLLKDIIQSKSVGIDPSIVRKQMELQKIRNKMKRKVDTKASKGRKLRYDIHPKLVNYMAPVRNTAVSDEARDNLVKCLFGRSLIQ